MKPKYLENREKKCYFFQDSYLQIIIIQNYKN